MKKVKWLHEIIVCNKLLEKALEHQTDQQKNFYIMYIRTKYDKTESSSKNDDKGKFPQGESLEELHKTSITSKFKKFYSDRSSNNLNLNFSLPGSYKYCL